MQSRLTKFKTHFCGELTKQNIGQDIEISGWVSTVRDLGGIIFVEVRDKSGLFQIVADPAKNPAAHEVLSHLKDESVIKASGKVTERPLDTYNPNLATGEIELYPETVEVLSKAKLLPFMIDDDQLVNEETRLKYRYLDIRRPKMANNLKLRHNVVTAMRNFLNKNSFLEVETPILINTTPEGARDYLVPSRVHPGKFFALPQSPQIYKQLLMVGGIERYYQIAKCFRDEDLRADRQPEFTQVDLEMSFVEQEDVIQLMEGMLVDAFNAANVEIQPNFPRLTYQEAMDRYGSDKPDTRFGLELFDVSDIFAASTFEAFAETVRTGGTVRAICVKGIANYSRKEMDDIRNLAINFGAKGLAWVTYGFDGTVKSPVMKFLTEQDMENLKNRANAEAGDIVFFVADKHKLVFDVLGRLRLHFGEKLELIDKSQHALLWLTDFPMFDYDEESGRYVSVHHPFTMPNPEDIEKMATNPAECRSIAYDVIYNGTELGGGSVRIHSPELQEKVFEAIGLSEEEIKVKFGYMIEAFQYGTPPHAGIALGLDRLIALLAKCESIREVMAFPKNSQAKCLMTNAPSEASEMQLRELHIKLNVPKHLQK